MHRILNSTSRIGRLLAILLALAVIGVPNLVGTSRTITYADGHGGVPAGQLVRKSLVGTILSVSGDSMTISTPHGAVTVGIGSAQVNAPPDKDVGTGALAPGQKVVVNLNRSPVDPDRPKKDKDDDDEQDGEVGTATTTDDGSGSTGGDTATSTDTTATSTQDSADTGTNDTATSAGETAPNDQTDTTTSTTTAQEPTATTTNSTSGPDSGTTTDATATTTDSTSGSTSSTSTDSTATSTDDGTTEGEGEGGSTEAEVVPFRAVNATVIIILPGKPTRSHQRAVCIGDTGEVELEDSIADDGTSASSTVEIESNAETTDSTDDSDGPKLKSNQCKKNGDGIVLLVKKNKRGSNKVEIVKGQRADKVDERLARILDKVKGPGKEKQAERLQKQIDRAKQKKAQQVQKAEKRVVVKAQQAKERKEKAERIQQGGGGQDGGSQGGGNSGGGNSGGGNSGGGNSGGGNSGGGNSGGGNQGGGNQGGGNQGGGKPDKGKK